MQQLQSINTNQHCFRYGQQPTCAPVSRDQMYPRPSTLGPSPGRSAMAVRDLFGSCYRQAGNREGPTGYLVRLQRTTRYLPALHTWTRYCAKCTRPNTHIHGKYIPRDNALRGRCDAMRTQYDTIRCNTMRYDTMGCSGGLGARSSRMSK